MNINQETNPAGGRMKFRKLRIVFSVLCGVACVLLIVLAVRSYDYVDVLYVPVSPTRIAVVESELGSVHFFSVPTATLPNDSPSHGILSKGIRLSYASNLERAVIAGHVSGDLIISISHSFLLVAFAALAVVPWLCWRFSLRALLIVTTLVAVWLGLVGWWSR